ncbi:MAG: hypothetical protein WAL25_05210 [Acidimicrobiia bacterium]
MVRRNLRLWVGVASFVVVVAALTAIALNRVPEGGASLDGRWDLVLVETPGGSVAPEAGTEWIEFDGRTFQGHLECIDFEGELSPGGPGNFSLDGWGYGTSCEVLSGTGEAFDLYFGDLSEYRLDTGLILQNVDGSVQFVFTRPGQRG